MGQRREALTHRQPHVSNIFVYTLPHRIADALTHMQADRISCGEVSCVPLDQQYIYQEKVKEEEKGEEWQSSCRIRSSS